MAKLMIELNRDELNQLQYPVVVETLNKGFFGKFARAFDREFGEGNERSTKLARKKAKYWYDVFYRWYLVRGTPEHYHFRIETLDFVKRLINICGE